MTRVLFFLFFLSTTAFSQVVDSDSLVDYIKIQGDSVIRSSIGLDKVVLLPKKGFKNSILTRIFFEQNPFVVLFKQAQKNY